MAVEADDGNYTCHLDSESKKKARDELNEIESDRACAVQTFRKWVHEQDSCFYFGSTRLDNQKRRLLIHRLGAIDDDLLKDKSSLVTVFRAVCLVVNWFSYDENVQVNGIKVLVDWSGITLHHLITLYKVENVKKVVKFLENSLPVRMKGMVMYNESPFFDAIYAMISPFLKEKTKKRVSFHGKNLVTAYKEIDKSVLPTEYLPDDYDGPRAGSVKDICAAMIEDMMRPEFRTYIKDLSSSKYRVDLSKKTQTSDDPGSYRKFNLD